MCGIAGFIDFSCPKSSVEILKKMIGLLRHRGPDASGIYKDEIAGLAHTRLSVIDLTGGDQPIHNEDESIWIVYNGEVFNYPELRRQLQQRGHQFYTNTDTEILVHLYEDHGPHFLNQLNGQFAFAIWDVEKKQLMLARDRVGIRPLFYYVNSDRLVFASEIKGIFADPCIPRSMNLQTLSDIFTCWAPLGSGTCFNDVHQILPGHCALFSRNGFHTWQYWQIPIEGPISNHSTLDDQVHRLSDLLHDATRIRLRSDVPVGAYLSGGLDSTYITSGIRNYFSNELCTFSVSFTDDRFDESSFQEKAASLLKTKHRSVQCTEDDIRETFPKVIWHTETPILRTAPAPLFRLSKLVRENHFKVVLTGEGADEIFAGYNIFKEDRIRRFWARQPQSNWRPLLLKRLYPYIFSQENNNAYNFLKAFYSKGLDQVASPVYSHLPRWQNTSQIQMFFSSNLRQQASSMDNFMDRYTSRLPSNFMKCDPLNRAQFTEMQIFLSNYLLSSQGDRMAMANSVEGRFPFLDHRVIEFAFTLPPSYRLNGLKEKFILKRAGKDSLPTEIVERPKQPYRAPIGQCFLGCKAHEYVHDLLSEKCISKAGYFDPAKVNRLVEKCRRHEGNLSSERENMALVGILSTQLLDDLFIQNFPSVDVAQIHDLKIVQK